jgi:predicted dithiol-disulfide oxidoreductase (DUF899 family)
MQLIVEHIMFGPDGDAACPICTTFMNELSQPVLDRLADRETAYVLASRAPLAKLQAYQAEMGWPLPWYSSYGSDFNYDFQVTVDPSAGQPDHTDLPYAFLDLTALGRQESWEEPQGRARSCAGEWRPRAPSGASRRRPGRRRRGHRSACWCRAAAGS